MPERIPLILGKGKKLAISVGSWDDYERVGERILEEKYKDYYYLDLRALRYGIPNLRALEEIAVYKRIIADISPPSPGAIMDALLAGADRIVMPTSKIITPKFLEEITDLAEKSPWLRADVKRGEIIFRGKLMKISPERALEEILSYDVEGILIWPPWEVPNPKYLEIMGEERTYYAIKIGGRMFLGKRGEGFCLTPQDL